MTEVQQIPHDMMVTVFLRPVIQGIYLQFTCFFNFRVSLHNTSTLCNSMGADFVRFEEDGIYSQILENPSKLGLSRLIMWDLSKLCVVYHILFKNDICNNLDRALYTYNTSLLWELLSLVHYLNLLWLANFNNLWHLSQLHIRVSQHLHNLCATHCLPFTKL